MSRSVPEWRGVTDDVAIPPRVRLRVFMRFGGVCQICFTKIVSGVEIDHLVALASGGSNCESNLVPVHAKCHRAKSKEDVAQKAATYKTQAHHLGIRKSRRPMPGSRASGFKRKMNGQVEKRA